MLYKIIIISFNIFIKKLNILLIITLNKRIFNRRNINSISKKKKKIKEFWFLCNYFKMYIIKNVFYSINYILFLRKKTLYNLISIFINFQFHLFY